MTLGLGGGTGDVPAGLPDEATLARMAAEFFGALPDASATDAAVPSEPPSELHALSPTPGALDTPSRPGLPSPPRLDPPGLGGGSTTGVAQYADAPTSHGEYTPSWLSPVAPPHEAVALDGLSLPGSAMASAPPPVTKPKGTGGSTTGGTQSTDSQTHSQGNPFGVTDVVVPGLPDIPSLAALAALALGDPYSAPATGSPEYPAPELADGRAPRSRSGDGRGPGDRAHQADQPHGTRQREYVPEWTSPFADVDISVPTLPPVPGYQALAAPAVPGAPPISAPSTPYSFLGESSAYPSATGAPLAYVADRPAGGRPVPEPGHRGFDVDAVRKHFPILSETVNGRPLIWFDNAATTQKPQAVIDRLAYFYAHENSNIHRAAHELAARSTDAYEGARDKVARFLGAGSSNECIFVRGATEAI
ncbi:MAG TPA: aminotransferase class V-fold PLP-dependent enzyme, partial [Sporichthya sp.]|nr:aminotransferase class V-fold PLP-dependent enzyme [Sporichthya sp.]